jgi:hypothetical protein
MGYGSNEFNEQSPTAAKTLVACSVPFFIDVLRSPTVRVCPTNSNTDWTEDEIKPRHWCTRTGLTNGRRSKLHATLPMTLVLRFFSAAVSDSDLESFAEYAAV